MVNIGLSVINVELRGLEVESLENPLDHYMLSTNDGDIGVVVGNMHSEGFLIGYIKYRLSSKNELWSNGFNYFERIVKHYGLDEIRGSTPWKTYIPCYDYYSPIIPVSKISHTYSPLKRVYEVLEDPGDELENIASSLLSEVLSCGVSRGVGITGSLLPRIHNAKYSDVDLVVYGWREGLAIIEFIEENPSIFTGFRDDRLRNWVKRVAIANNLSMRETLYYYRRWRRGLYRGREYSIIYNDGVYRRIDNCESWRSIGFIEVKVVIESGLDALNYPSKSSIVNWEFIRGAKPDSDIEHILSFEALYIPLFLEGGKAYVRGLLQYQPIDGVYRVLVGVSEGLTYIKPII